MEVYDILMVLVLAGATLFGAWKGMAWQLASLASLVLSYFSSLQFSGLLAPHLGQKAPWDRFLAMLVLYLGTSLAVWLGFRIVAGVIDRVKLKEFDRQIGALFGAAKGVLLCVAITFFAVGLVPAARDRIIGSRSGYYIAVLLDRADRVMPPEVDQVLAPYLNRLEEQLEANPIRQAQSLGDDRRF